MHGDNMKLTVLLLQSGSRKEGSKHFVAKFILTFMYVWYTSSREYASDVSALTTRWHVSLLLTVAPWLVSWRGWILC